MNWFRPPRPSPALVISVIALIMAMGGTGYAAFTLPKNSVGSKQLKKNAVISSKIKNNAVTGSKVKNHSLTGNDINVGALGTVPTAANANHATNADSANNAAHATSADNVAGMTPVHFSVKGAASSGPFTMLDVAGLKLTLSCNGSANPVVTATNDSGSAAEFEFVRVSNTSAVAESGSASFQPGNTVDVIGATTTGHVSFAFYRVDGPTVTGQFGYDNSPAFGSFVGCAAGGNAIAG